MASTPTDGTMESDTAFIAFLEQNIEDTVSLAISVKVDGTEKATVATNGWSDNSGANDGSTVAKAMTATASAGYNYMQEGLGYCYTIEAPVVVADVNMPAAVATKLRREIQCGTNTREKQ